MLKLTQLAGFGSGGGGTDATPNAINFGDISDSGFTATAGTSVATVTGIDTTITLRLSLSASMSGVRAVSVYRNGAFVSQKTSGTTIDLTIMNGETFQYFFTNALDNTTWSGTATLSNLSDGGTILDTFAFTLQDTGEDGGVDVVVTF
jgi:hypothetical protein